MAITSYVSPAEAAAIRGEFRNLEATVEVVFWDVAWIAYALERPDGSWDDGTDDERWQVAVSGEGRLAANGNGGPVIGEDVIYQQSPYRLRIQAGTVLAPNMKLSIGNRLFKVEGVEDRAGERQHTNAYLTEIFGEALPEVAP